MERTLAPLLIASALLTGCSETDTASQKLSNASENFEIERRIVFINDSYMLTVIGLCSIKSGDSSIGVNNVTILCKTDEQEFKKHYLSLGSNTAIFSQQITRAKPGTYPYRVVFERK